MSNERFHLKSLVQLYPGKGGWHFLTIPSEISKELADRYSLSKQGWGSLPVTVTIGTTVWKTSIFPIKKTASYLLPLKLEVREKQAIGAGDTVNFELKVR